MEWMELIKVYGPLGIGWVIALYLGKFVLNRYDKDIESKIELATALNALSRIIKDGNNHTRG